MYSSIYIVVHIYIYLYICPEQHLRNTPIQKENFQIPFFEKNYNF